MAAPAGHASSGTRGRMSRVSRARGWNAEPLGAGAVSRPRAPAHFLWPLLGRPRLLKSVVSKLTNYTQTATGESVRGLAPREEAQQMPSRPHPRKAGAQVFSLCEVWPLREALAPWTQSPGLSCTSWAWRGRASSPAPPSISHHLFSRPLEKWGLGRSGKSPLGKVLHLLFCGLKFNWYHEPLTTESTASSHQASAVSPVCYPVKCQ